MKALFDRALDLHQRGRDDEATKAYMELLQHDVRNLGALTNVGTLLYNGGHRSAAMVAYRQAVACHPQNVPARVNLANALYDAQDYHGAQDEYVAALAVDPYYAQAHQGLSYVLDRMGDTEGARRHRDLGFRESPITHVPYRGSERAIMVLLLVSARGGNISTDRFLDDRVFFVTKLFADYFDPAGHVPFHAFVFNAIGEADLCGDALEAAAALVKRTNAAVVNPPELVARTGRVENARRLAHLPGVVTPLTTTFARERLRQPGAAELLAREGFTFPLLLRTPGFHTGMHFVFATRPEDVAEAAQTLPGEELTAIAFLDARGADGLYRKYRVMTIDGKLYPLHLAISASWKVHYFSAGMAEAPERRDEERRFLDDAAAAIGPRAIAALEAIAATIGLDYGGIDFGIDPHGNVLLFETNATMMVPTPEVDPRFAYRRPAVERIHAAVRAMLLERAAR